jgi:hypothetical protein
MQMPSDKPPVIGEALQRELVDRLGESPTSPWGHAWVYEDVLVVLVPWDDEEAFAEGPIIFVDETRHEASSTFALGALLVDRIEVLSLAMGFVGLLLKIREAHPEFWPLQSAPPRLHLQDLSPEVARANTPWRYLTPADLERLLRIILDGIKSLKVKPWIFPVTEEELGLAFVRNVKVVPQRNAWPDLRVQAAAIQFQMAAELSLNSENRCEMVVDHDPAMVGVRPSRRQATLRFRDVLMGGEVGQKIRQRLMWDPSARYSSQFPLTLAWKEFSQRGHAFHPLINSIGLQSIDVYLGLWRQLSLDGESPLGITAEDLGGFHTPIMTWYR